MKTPNQLLRKVKILINTKSAMETKNFHPAVMRDEINLNCPKDFFTAKSG